MSKWKAEPLPIHGFRIVDGQGKQIVADIYDEEIAMQIVREHDACESLTTQEDTNAE